jgi:hypothetical protein
MMGPAGQRATDVCAKSWYVALSKFSVKARVYCVHDWPACGHARGARAAAAASMQTTAGTERLPWRLKPLHFIAYPLS